MMFTCRAPVHETLQALCYFRSQPPPRGRVPFFFAWYRAMSAAAINCLGDEPCTGNAATPSDSVTIPSDLPRWDICNSLASSRDYRREAA
jgi:hypothetical protein